MKRALIMATAFLLYACNDGKIVTSDALVEDSASDQDATMDTSLPDTAPDDAPSSDAPAPDARPLLTTMCSGSGGGGGPLWPCTKQSDCDEHGLYCNLTRGECVSCTKDNHCSSARPHCFEQFYCVQCEEDSHCAIGAGNTGLCDAKRKECVRCVGDAECVQSELGRYCEDNARCYPCNFDQECIDAKLGKVCMFMECWQCDDDSDCEKGKGDTGKCLLEMSDLAGSCVRCESDEDCEAAQLGHACVDSVCKPCRTDEHCTKGPEDTGYCFAANNKCIACETVQDCEDAFPEEEEIGCRPHR